jgi:hypothetical protein
LVFFIDICITNQFASHNPGFTPPDSLGASCQTSQTIDTNSDPKELTFEQRESVLRKRSRDVEAEEHGEESDSNSG